MVQVHVVGGDIHDDEDERDEGEESMVVEESKEVELRMEGMKLMTSGGVGVGKGWLDVDDCLLREIVVPSPFVHHNALD